MGLPSCSLWFFTARTDVWFMMNTIPHLVKMSQFPFEEKVLAIDTAPLSGEKVNRPGLGTMEELRACGEKLVKDGIIDRLVDFNYDPSYRQRIYQKHFGSPLRSTHNYKGYPIFGSIFKIESCRSDYMVHYDSDMMLYQEPDYSWICEGIELMETHPEMMFVRPLSGPPRPDGTIYSQHPCTKNPDGFYQFKFFGSRAYLLNCRRYDRLLPITPLWRSYKNTFLDHLPDGLKAWGNILTGKGKLDSWEIMVSRSLEQSNYYRATLTNAKGWTLHPNERSAAFRQAWPTIIEKIEAGIYPPTQAGYYDLIPELWY
ncbi:MAG: hypothetical protein GPI90_02050 [Microcystis aeruginosa K13-05]|jgi:hypothetical protein|uniref:hypothetical protein n=1 Tax=unclassified Microcystis TaxID=2643300 RepID=UPI0022C36159|nr:MULTISPECIES: hypothetical protein [unclassified Microcystis]NCR78850.1 hypothetical protein [Microcystis aeruginosa K13-10]NCR83496.1 hypothetical protein [Microcystis aeruginosa K13-05]MCZ8028246.1 hypothetical protein [Microcystis sp. LE19-10.1B]MCZ8047080.1 hypothetical protein [Microcystis sp. LE19-41.2A]MCZ8118763.1 hypothetical protein [Microcystis sp. LE18-22.4A]